VSESAVRGDYFDRARSAAAVILAVAAALVIVGSFLDWVRITPPDTAAGRRQASDPFTGVDARDGWIVVGAGVALAICAPLLVIRRRGFYAGLAFLASMIIGAIAFADYRGINDLRSAISERMDVVGDADPSIGIALVAAGAFAGMAGAILGMIATPSQRRSVDREAEI
jgi:hypothetical protein